MGTGYVHAIEYAAHQIGVFLDHELRDLRLSQADAHVLARLADGPSTPGELHRLFGHKRSTLTHVLDRLEGRGLVTREVQLADRRSFRVELTQQGLEVATKVAAAVDELERRVARATSARDRAGFDAVIAAMRAARPSRAVHARRRRATYS